MKRRLSIVLIVAGACVMSAAMGMTMTHRADESTMYWFGLGGVLAVIGIGTIQRR